MRTWLYVGHLALVGMWLLLFLIPGLAGDPLPPEISFSQFGLGPRGWMFSLWAMLLSVAGFAYFRLSQRRTRTALVLLVIGTVGCVVMSIVRTDPGGLQQSTSAQIHTTASALALFGIPYGYFALLWSLGGRWRQLGIPLAVIHTVSIGLLLISATGVDTAGIGAARSWAFWQFIAVLADHLMALAVGIGTHLRLRPESAQATSIQ